ncbi:DNA damage-binding protein cmr1-like isoform X1 [Triticum urartu]|uniref:WD repeat-containing protein 76 n=1 Tax=Triticum urartu TaxID=4572 RepID=A0A8R7JYT1_TRIUA|nr:DNA damage-binding protein cmr1-like isoform X1 [Triticum urartu]
MAEDGLNDYERLRQENIRRNQEKLAPLRRKADELSAPIRLAKPKRPYQVRPKAPTGPVRSSGRARGIAPGNLPPDLSLTPSLASSILGGGAGTNVRAADDFNAGRGMVLMRAHVRNVVPCSIESMRVLPLADQTVVAAGDKRGNIGYWDVDGVSEDADGVDGVVFSYWPHKCPVSAIVAHQVAPHKFYSSSHQGEICLMDFEKEKYSMVHLWEWPVYSLCQAQNSARCLYFGNEKGGLTLFDEREGKVLTTWDVHEERINSIDFHPEKPHMLATSSKDQTACIWDVRNIKRKEPDSLKVFKLKKSAQSAYFSPSGRMLAVTSSSSSICGTVRVFCVDDFEKSHSVESNNQTGIWPSAFKVI